MQHRPSRALRTLVSTLTALATIVTPYAAAVPVASADDSGWHIHGFGAYVNNGWSGGINVRISDNIRASANSQNDVVAYYGFGFALPAGATVKGIEVEIEGYTSSTRQIEVSLSGNNGASYSAPYTTKLPVGPLSEAVNGLGGAADLWGGTWTPGMLADGNFRVKLDATSVGPNPVVYVDQLRVRVQYTPKRRGGRNRQQYGALVLEKYIRSDTAASFDDFRYDVDGAAFGSNGKFDDSGRNTFDNVPTGTYSIREREPDGYSVAYGGDCDENGEITVPANGSVTCTVTNTADGWEEEDGERGPEPTPIPDSEEEGDGPPARTGTLVVQKIILYGDDASVSYDDFSFTVGEESRTFEKDGSNELELETGRYVVAEEPLSGWTVAYGGDCDTEGNITVSDGRTVICTVANTIGVGGFNPGSSIPAPTPTPTPPPRTPTPTPPVLPSVTASPSEPASPSTDENLTATMSGFIPPCMPGQLSWIILNGLLFVILMWWLSRDSGFRWLRSLLVLAVAAGFMFWWQSTCGAEPRWLAAILAAIVLLRLWLRNR